MSLSDMIFQNLDQDRFILNKKLLDNPLEEIVFTKDVSCRKSRGLLDRSYKCIHCHQLSKIARSLPDFVVEVGDIRGRKFSLISQNAANYFWATFPLVCYDNFRGSLLISSLAEKIGLFTLNCLVSAYICTEKTILQERFLPLQVLDMNLFKQLLLTLKVLESYAFVADDLVLEVAPEEPLDFFAYGIKVNSSMTLKIKGWNNASISFNKWRFVAGSRLRGSILQASGNILQASVNTPQVSSECKEEWFRSRAGYHDLKHWGETSYNIYLVLLKYRSLLSPEVEDYFAQLWLPQEYPQVLASQDIDLQYFSLRRKPVDFLLKQLVPG